MTKSYFSKAVIISFFSIAVFQCFSQSSAIDYRRSSLTMVLIENNKLGKDKELITKAYYSNPFPEKYNNHIITDKVFDPEKLKLTTQDYLDAGFYKDTLKTIKDFLGAAKKPLNPLRYVAKDSSKAVQEPSPEELNNIYIQKYIKEKGLAKQIVSSWFNIKSDGNYDWELIKERGRYSASAQKTEQAATAAQSTDFLMDFDLIGNTYTVFNKMTFFENEPAARLVRDAAKIETAKKLAGKPDILLQKAYEGIEAVYNKTKEGYTVICNNYLYQLVWNDSIAQKAKTDIFNGTTVNMQAYNASDLFKMVYVGKTTVSSIVTFKIGEKRTQEQIIDLQVKRTLDNALAKLQKEYVQFRPVSPIASVAPVTAQIGLKEGVEPGQSFEILEQSFNKLGLPEWKSIGKVSVDKNAPIWDNTAGAEVKLDEKGVEIKTPSFTTFKGGKNAQVGLHYIRLIK